MLNTQWLACDNTRIFVRQWHAPRPIKGVVHVLHGMMEHSGMYHEWALKLNALGWDVVAHDHAGSGLTISNSWGRDALPMDGDTHMLTTAMHVKDWLLAHYAGLPMVRYGHSMGAFLAVNMQQKDSAGNAMILSAPMHEPKAMLTVKQGLVWALAQVLGVNARANLAHALTFNRLNRHFAPIFTPVDWVSSDESVLNLYMHDPLCGNIATWGYYYSLITCFKRAINAPGPWPKMMMIVGEYDPLSTGGKAVRNRFKAMASVAEYAEFVCVPGARHKIEGSGGDGIANVGRFLNQL